MRDKWSLHEDNDLTETKKVGIMGKWSGTKERWSLTRGLTYSDLTETNKIVITDKLPLTTVS